MLAAADPSAPPRDRGPESVLYRLPTTEAMDKVCKMLGVDATGLPVHVGAGSSHKLCRVFGFSAFTTAGIHAPVRSVSAGPPVVRGTRYDGAAAPALAAEDADVPARHRFSWSPARPAGVDQRPVEMQRPPPGWAAAPTADAAAAPPSCEKLSRVLGDKAPVDVSVRDLEQAGDRGLSALLLSALPLCYFFIYLLHVHCPELLLFVLDLRALETRVYLTEDECLRDALRLYSTYISEEQSCGSRSVGLQINISQRARRLVITALRAKRAAPRLKSAFWLAKHEAMAMLGSFWVDFARGCDRSAGARSRPRAATPGAESMFHRPRQRSLSTDRDLAAFLVQEGSAPASAAVSATNARCRPVWNAMVYTLGYSSLYSPETKRDTLRYLCRCLVAEYPPRHVVRAPSGDVYSAPPPQASWSRQSLRLRALLLPCDDGSVFFQRRPAADSPAVPLGGYDTCFGETPSGQERGHLLYDRVQELLVSRTLGPAFVGYWLQTLAKAATLA